MIPLVKPAVFPEQEQFLRELVHNPQYHTVGHFARLCEDWFEKRFTGSRVWMVTSCTHALEAAFMALDLPPGSEVIMPSWNFVSAGNAAFRAGLTPVWADIDSGGNISPESVEEAITPNTRALLVMHYMGIPARLRELLHIAGHYGLYVIEDAAYGVFSAYEGKPLGSFGHLGCMSFDHTKPLHSGRGGAIVVNDSGLAESVEKIIDMGTDKAAFLRGENDCYKWVSPGSKYRMPEASAALLYAALLHYEEIGDGLTRSLNRYNEETGLSVYGRAGAFINLPEGFDRSEVIKKFNKAGVFSTFHYQPLHQSDFGSRFTKPGMKLENTRYFAETVLRLPLYYGLSQTETERVINVLKDL